VPPPRLGQRLLTAALRTGVRISLRPALSPRVPPRVQRAWTELLATINLIPGGTLRTPVDMGGVPALRIQHASGSGHRAIVYMHGGGYVIGSARAESIIPANIARASGATVYTLDYRLAPEHPFPAAVEDAQAAYEWLINRGADPSRIMLVGNSAGAGLAAAAAVRARDMGQPLPGAIALISPWVDLTLSGESIESKSSVDPMLTREWLSECARLYLDGAAPDDPLVSPLFADLTGLPPILIQHGTREILLSDAERLAERAAAAGVATEVQRYDGLWHAFQLHAGVLRASDRAIARLAEFLSRPG
jgi:monoterpene epsilon-lactone hydrolase